jgi:hypothetical protein
MSTIPVSTIPRGSSTISPARSKTNYLDRGVVTVSVEEFLKSGRESVELLIMRIDAQSTDLSVSAAERMDRGSGYVRGLQGEPRYVRPSGEEITDPVRMRCDSIALQEHFELVARASKADVVAAISYGDLMTNREYVCIKRVPREVGDAWKEESSYQESTVVRTKRIA